MELKDVRSHSQLNEYYTINNLHLIKEKIDRLKIEIGVQGIINQSNNNLESILACLEQQVLEVWDHRSCSEHKARTGPRPTNPEAHERIQKLKIGCTANCSNDYKNLLAQLGSVHRKLLKIIDIMHENNFSNEDIAIFDNYADIIHDLHTNLSDLLDSEIQDLFKA